MNNGNIAIEGGSNGPVEESIPEGIVLNEHAQVCLQQLLRVWLGFERDLSKVPLLRRIDLGTYTTEDHQVFLRNICLLYTSPSPRDRTRSRMPSSA